MNTNVNNVTFQANVKTLIRPKNKTAFEKICKEFEKRTSAYPQDTLYITKTKNGADSWHITNKKRGDFYKGEEIFTNSIDDHIEELGAKKFTQELINTLKAMKLERDIYKNAKHLKIELDKTKGVVKAYKNMSTAYRNDGNVEMAKRYEYLAQRNSDKLEKLDIEYNKYLNKFNKKIKEFSKEFPEISQVELYFV